MSDLVRLSKAITERYRIERELGQGGMAAVYLAEDVRHRRKVAVKVLHPELSAVLGPERFLKEIELTAALQHPHILPLFDSGAADGLLYYVMPYVAGESLRTRLAREKQLPIGDAIRIADEVAGALDYAHRQGVVHRDIKPENILLHEGRALVADFGIALAVQHAGGSRMTQTGMSLGTPQYMSPEQAMGEREITPRSDIYALGCVTYEMLVGEPPFTGPSAQAIVARVLTDSPRSLRAQRHTISEQVDAAVLQALEKLPADRFGTPAEFAAALTDRGTGGQMVGRSTGRGSLQPSARPTIRLTAILAGFTLAAIGLAAWALLKKPALAVRPVMRFSLATPTEARFLELGGNSISMAPDGSRLVYLGGSVGRVNQLYLWSLDGGTPVAVPGSENATYPFFSPDGQSVGFLAGGQLRRVSLTGGGSVVIGGLASSSGFRGATWTSRGEVVFSTSTGFGRISAEGGNIRPIVLQDSTVTPLFPEALPGGTSVAVALFQRTKPVELAVIGLDNGKITRLGIQGSNPRYVEPGFLAFTSPEGDLLAVPFDPSGGRVTGAAKQVAERISLGVLGVGRVALSRTGTVAYSEGTASSEAELFLVDRRGTARPLNAPKRAYWAPRFSPDGRRIAVAIGPHPNTPIDIWVYDLGLGTLSRLTTDSTSTNQEWSPDGRRILHRRAGEVFRIMAETPDGSAPPESLYASNGDLWEAIATRSGDTLITRELRTETDRDIFLVPLKPAGAPIPWAAGPRIQAEPALSPDGRWLAYSSEESGTFEVYVRAFPGPGPRYQISNGGGQSPRWNPRGGELFFLARDSLTVVPLRSNGNSLEQGRATSLFLFRYRLGNFHAAYDVSPDGSSIIAAGSGVPLTASLHVVVNWFDQPWKN